MSDLWQSIKKNLYETSEVIADKVDEYSRIGRVKIDVMNIKRKLLRKFTELGAKTFERLENEDGAELKDDLDIGALIEEIKDIQQELASKKQELKEDSADN